MPEFDVDISGIDCSMGPVRLFGGSRNQRLALEVADKMHVYIYIHIVWSELRKRNALISVICQAIPFKLNKKGHLGILSTLPAFGSCVGSL